MRYKLQLTLAFIIIVLFVAPFVSANAAAAAAIIASSHRAQEEAAQSQVSSGCVAPIDWSIENNCKLNHNYRDPLNEYYCDGANIRYYLTTSCNGTIISQRSQDMTVQNEMISQLDMIMNWSTIILVSVIVFGLILWVCAEIITRLSK